MVSRKHLQPFIPLLLSLLLGLVLVILVEDFVRDVLLGPLLYAAWFLSLLIQSIPQGVLWGGFVLALMVIAYLSLAKESPPRSSKWKTPPKSMGPVERWARILGYAQANKFSKWRLAQALKRLTRKLHSPLEKAGQPERDLAGLDIPAEILAYFETPQPSFPSFWDRLHSSGEEAESPLDLDPEIVIRFLEERLEP